MTFVQVLALYAWGDLAPGQTAVVEFTVQVENAIRVGLLQLDGEYVPPDPQTYLHQPLDADLTAIADQGTLPYGRSLLLTGDAPSARTLLGISSTPTVLDFKEAVVVASTANIPSLSGTKTIDGQSAGIGARVLLKDQTTGSQNGIWVVAAGAWARATDADADAEVTAGMTLPVVSGTANGGRVFLLTTPDPIVVGTTALTFVRINAGDLAAANNLSDLANAATARTNLGLGTAATTAATAYATAAQGAAADAAAPLANVYTKTAADARFAPVDLIVSDPAFVSTDTFDKTGATDVAAIFNRAAVAANTAYVSDGRVRRVLIPAGFYKLSSVEITPLSGVQWVGAGQDSTVFLPYGTITAFKNLSVTLGAPLTDATWTDLTIDGTNQTNGSSYTTSLKGIFVQYMLRPKFRNVTIKNTWATGFGVDYLVAAEFVKCTADNCGRQVALLSRDPSTVSGSSGFGIGTGKYLIESVLFDGCTASNCGIHGFFTEKQTSATYYSQGVRMIGCLAQGNWIGFRDCGSIGAIVQGSQFLNNAYCGVSLDKTILAANAGQNGIVSGNIMNGNGATPGGSLVGAGLVIGAAALGGYKIAGNKIWGNTGHGIHAESTGVIGGRFLIDDNHVHDNTINGIFIECAAPGIRIRRNNTHGNATLGIRFAGALTTSGASIRSNECEDGISIEHTMSGNYVNDLNIVTDAAPSGIASTGVTRTSVSLSWIAPINTAGLTDYSIQYRTSPSGSWTEVSHAASTTRSITVTGLTEGTAYDFRVAAIYGATGTYCSPITATPGLSVLYADLFQRADADMSGSVANDGPSPLTWSNASSGNGTGVMGITSLFGKATAGTSAANAFGLLNAGADGQAEAKAGFLFSTLANRRASLVFRYQASDNYLRITANQISGTNEWRLQKVVGGVATTLATGPATAATNDVVAAKFIGSTITWYINGTSQGAVTETSFQTATYVGLTGTFSQDPSSKWTYFKYYV